MEEISNKLARLAEKQAELNKLVDEVQASCPHSEKSIVYADMSPVGDVGPPPFRVCKVCGWHEEGWGKGYHRLKGTLGFPHRLSRQDAGAYIRTYHTTKEVVADTATWDGEKWS